MNLKLYECNLTKQLIFILYRYTLISQFKYNLVVKTGLNNS